MHSALTAASEEAVAGRQEMDRASENTANQSAAATAAVALAEAEVTAIRGVEEATAIGRAQLHTTREALREAKQETLGEDAMAKISLIRVELTRAQESAGMMSRVNELERQVAAVSYTHLTLPTKA